MILRGRLSSRDRHAKIIALRQASCYRAPSRKTYSATGDLTLHGHTRSVTFPVKAELTAGAIEVQGSIPVLFSKWGIPNPSFTGFVTTQNHGIMEFLLDFRHA